MMVRHTFPRIDWQADSRAEADQLRRRLRELRRERWGGLALAWLLGFVTLPVLVPMLFGTLQRLAELFGP